MKKVLGKTGKAISVFIAISWLVFSLALIYEGGLYVINSNADPELSFSYFFIAGCFLLLAVLLIRRITKRNKVEDEYKKLVKSHFNARTRI